MARYKPEGWEVARLERLGWRRDSEGWWWPVAECGYGRTFVEACREQGRREKAQRRAARSADLAGTGGAK